MSDRDEPITVALRDLADQAAPPRLLVDAAWRAGRRRRRAAIAAAAVTLAAALAAVAAAPTVLSGTILARPAKPLAGSAPGRWARLPAAPIAPRGEYAAVWTGKQMIVWGGYGSAPQYGDGAAYDPSTRTWTKIAAGPLAARGGAVTVWTGKEMLIFGGVSSSRTYSDGAAYDPATNTWRKLAPTPGSLGQLTDSGSYAVWTGRVMVAWGFFGSRGSGAHGDGSLAAATYNPAANSWTTGTVAPAQAPLFGDAFWTGKEMIVWGSSSFGLGGHLEGFAYDPATRRWSALPPSPLVQAGRASMLAAWTGRYLVVGGGDSPAGLQKDAAAYDPATGSWLRLPDAPVGFEGNGTGYTETPPDIWTGTSVITIEDGVPGGRPLSLDLATGSWSLGPKAPVPGLQEAHEIWTGSQVLIWGGGVAVGDTCCRLEPGYSYTP
jgi:hypothetical protein